MNSAKNVWRLQRLDKIALFFVLLFSCVISFGFLLNPHSAHADITSNLQGWWTFDSADTSWVLKTFF
jgi:hypothetical protein